MSVPGESFHVKVSPGAVCVCAQTRASKRSGLIDSQEPSLQCGQNPHRSSAPPVRSTSAPDGLRRTSMTAVIF